MARLRNGNGNMNGAMRYMHLRDQGSTGICERTGVHTTKTLANVTCQFCIAKAKSWNAPPEQFQ